MTDADFVRAVLVTPQDDAPRTIYADWLEEQGDAARAEFIRLGCELAAWPRGMCKAGCYQRLHSALCPIANVASRCTLLLASNVGVWTKSLPESLTTKKCPYCVDKPMCGETGVLECRQCKYRATGLDRVDFSRGFVSHVTLTRAEFMEHAAEIFARHPITSVRLSDCEPWNRHGEGQCGWWHPDTSATPDGIPTPIHNRLTGYESTVAITAVDLWRWYPTAEAAHAALSRACVDYGRDLVGLPPIE